MNLIQEAMFVFQFHLFSSCPMLFKVLAWFCWILAVDFMKRVSSNVSVCLPCDGAENEAELSVKLLSLLFISKLSFIPIHFFPTSFHLFLLTLVFLCLCLLANLPFVFFLPNQSSLSSTNILSFVFIIYTCPIKILKPS